MTSLNLNYQDKIILICQHLVSVTNKYNLSPKTKPYKEYIFKETSHFPKNISLSKRTQAIAENNKCECMVCGKVHGEPTKNTCSRKCFNLLKIKKFDNIRTQRNIEFIKNSIRDNQGIEYEDYVECRICGYRNDTMISNHIKIHNITDVEYKKAYQVDRMSVNSFGFRKGEDNPAYQHKGEFSPWSDKFINPNNISVDECKARAQKTITDNGNRNTTLSYYLNRGHSEKEGKALLSERQTTFSKKLCIERHGEEKGLDIWRDRQYQWQNTLNSKSDEEKDEINSKKSAKVNYRSLWNRSLDSDGIFYMIQITPEMIKIGITSKNSLSQRYHKDDLDGCEILYLKEASINQCFMTEQLLKREFFHKMISKDIQFKNFGWTETFLVSAEEIIQSADKLILSEIEEKFNETFRKTKP